MSIAGYGGNTGAIPALGTVSQERNLEQFQMNSESLSQKVKMHDI